MCVCVALVRIHVYRREDRTCRRTASCASTLRRMRVGTVSEGSRGWRSVRGTEGCGRRAIVGVAPRLPWRLSARRPINSIPMATTDNIGHTPCRTTTPSFGHSVLPLTERKADGEEESRPMRATRMEASSKKIFQIPPSPFVLKLSPPSRRPPFTLSFPCLCFSFCLSFSPPNFSIPFHLFTLPSFLLSISICAIGRAIPVSLFTGGFCTHLRASHAASSDHPFNEKTLLPSKWTLPSAYCSKIPTPVYSTLLGTVFLLLLQGYRSTSFVCNASFVHRALDWKLMECGAREIVDRSQRACFYVYLDRAIYLLVARDWFFKKQHPLSHGEPCEKWTRQCNQFYSPRRFETRNSISRRKKKKRFVHCTLSYGLIMRVLLEVAQVTNPFQSTHE